MKKLLIYKKKVAARADVKEVKFVTKEEALENFKKQQKGKKVADLIDSNENPLPRSLEIKADQAENLDQIAKFLENGQFKPIIHNISYQENKKVIDRLIGTTVFLKKMGWAFSGVFVAISILVILNTIRLTILTRKNEIEIMRLVGASDSFVKVPFVVEGILYGLIATAFTTVILKLGISLLDQKMDQYLGLTFSDRITRLFAGNFFTITGLELLVGISMGIICSLISMRKYLKV